MHGWNTSFLLGWPIFRGYVSFREGRSFISYLSTFFCSKLVVENANVKRLVAGIILQVPFTKHTHTQSWMENGPWMAPIFLPLNLKDGQPCWSSRQPSFGPNSCIRFGHPCQDVSQNTCCSTQKNRTALKRCQPFFRFPGISNRLGFRMDFGDVPFLSEN